ACSGPVPDCQQIPSRTLPFSWLQPGLYLSPGIIVVLANEIADMPVQGKFHILHAPALNRIGDDHFRLALAGWFQSRERCHDGREVMAIDPVHFPSERLEPS